MFFAVADAVVTLQHYDDHLLSLLLLLLLFVLWSLPFVNVERQKIYWSMATRGRERERERENSENEAKLREELSENFVIFASEKFAQFPSPLFSSVTLFLPPPTFNSYIFVANTSIWHFSWTTFSACLFSCQKYFFEISFHFIFFFSSPLKRFYFISMFFMSWTRVSLKLTAAKASS